jgi:SAM-dependent methyltransferase
MLEINRAAESGSWKAALVNSEDDAVRRASGMMLNLDRANWHWLTNVPADGRVLDLGAGTGTNSHALALYYREVVALEPVQERIDFMRHRFSQEELRNVKIIRSSLWTLPFADSSFDLVAMNGVLEWVAAGREGDPRELQNQALKNAYSLLRDGGFLYVGIENRTGLGYFAGYADPHCDLPFVTVMPRRLAHWYAKRRGHQQGYRNYLYSSGGYQKLLREAGFSSVDVYLAVPSYNHPRFFLPLKENLFSYYSRNFTVPPAKGLRRLLHATLSGLGILKHCDYSYALIARK